MKKILSNITHSFSSKSNYSKYRNEIFIYLVFLSIYTMINITIYFVDKNNKYNTGIILAIAFIVFLWQTGALAFRLYEVRNNKIDLNIMNGEYNFQSESVDINYKDLKKILQKTNVGFKLYCKGTDDKNHVIRVRVLLYEKKQKIEKRYYFDRVEYDLGKVLMLVNELNLVNNSKVIILGNDIAKKNNSEYIKQLLSEYA